MSEENLPALAPTTDIVGKDLDLVNDFVAKGRPGFMELPEEDAKKMFELYRSGQTYRQIAGIMRQPKALVMYLSKNVQWFERRQEYIVELETAKLARIQEAHTLHQDLLLRYIHALHKKIGTELNSFMASDDNKKLDDMNLKQLEICMKMMESLRKSTEAPKAAAPLVGITMPDGATMTRTGDNTIEITPKEKSTASMLKRLGDLRRAEEAKARGEK